MYVSEIQYSGCVHMEEALAVENLSKIGQILPVFDENTLLGWSSTSIPYEIDWKLLFQFAKGPNFSQQSKNH